MVRAYGQAMRQAEQEQRVREVTQALAAMRAEYRSALLAMYDVELGKRPRGMREAASVIGVSVNTYRVIAEGGYAWLEARLALA